MPKHVLRLSLVVVLLTFGGSGSAKESVFIGTSMKTLAGLYKVTYGFAFYGHAISISPNGSVTLKVSGDRVEHFVNGKITYFSPAGFVVKFTDLKGSSVEMKFVYQKGYPTSFFHDDGPAGVTIFTRQ